VILCGAVASRAEDKDTIDMAVIGGLKDDAALKTYRVIHFRPFDPVHKRTEATVKGADGKQFQVAKGAPQVILEMSADAAKVKPAVDKAVNEFAARGFRSLGVARADAAGTMSPRRSWIESPGTSSRAGGVIHFPSRLTRAVTASLAFKAAMALPAWRSSQKPTTALATRSNR
jgi:magnesium-transporting ATPase (P-type)